jgi:hypothetical protein
MGEEDPASNEDEDKTTCDFRLRAKRQAKPRAKGGPGPAEQGCNACNREAR